MASAAVTGYTGFIGKKLVEALLKEGFTVYPVGRDFRHIDCDRVYHLASPSTTERIESNPTGVMDTIMDATRAALKICPDALFINASSKGAIDLAESPQGCYNVAKRSMETYIRFSGVKFLNYRIPSVYGPGMHESNFIKRCINGNAYAPLEPGKIHYIAHIDDVVDALVHLTEIKTEEITLGEIYESFSSGRRGLYRPTSDTPVTRKG